MKISIMASMVGLAMTSVAATAASPGDTGFAKSDYTGFEKTEYDPFVSSDAGGAPRPAAGATSSSVLASFAGISQYDVAAYHRNFIPPDTMGAVGTTQFTQFANGGFAVFNKDGTVAKAESDVAFWAAAGRTGTNGDSRVLFDKAANRWIALSFANDVSAIQIAVSDTSDATGTWKSTKFQGFTPGGFADYPTLAMDTHAVYIGTNNFNPNGSFGGTTLNVIPLSSLIGASAPSVVGLKQFNTPYNSTTGGQDGGYAIQGVNSTTASTTGHVEAASLFFNDVIRYDIANVATKNQVRVNGQYLGVANYDVPGPARQPNLGGASDINPNPPTSPSYFPSNNRVIDTLDSRIGANVWEVNGRIYSVYTVTPVGTDHTVVRYDVVDAATNKILDEGQIGDGKRDYWQGSINVNEFGQVVIGYNRSGSHKGDVITFLAQAYATDKNGVLHVRGPADVLKISAVDDYHNGSVDGFVASGRQRWGDYSAVSLDPTDSSRFWVIGEYALPFNDAAGGHPGGTGGSRWGTWISEINVGAPAAVPEPATWAMMIAGFGLVGAMARRRRSGYLTA